MTEDRQAIIEQVRHRAHANFSAGFNCAECVTEAVWALIKSDLPADAWKLATGFGGGIGLYGDTCGALTGAILAVGAVHGRGTLPKGIDRRDILTKSRTQLYEDPGLYRIFNQLPNWFVTQYGTTLCREITTAWRANWLCREHALHCREIISQTAGRAVELMLLSRDELATLKFGIVVEETE
ncbi:C_GCAxxG_C_C family protein [Candidatus Bipolaricaulota bacterium]|nr:C_GCAxxG_C_C family protein [Candidatus Bipolaricaulota bacterium]